MIDRQSFIAGLIGLPWRAGARGPDAYDCYHLARYVEQELFGRALPDVDVPSSMTYLWACKTIARHPERGRWAEVSTNEFGMIVARDGALVLMSRLIHRDAPAHVGVWLAAEGRIMHVDETGVKCEPPTMLTARGWSLRAFEPMS